MSIEETRKRREAKLAQEQQPTQAAQQQLDIQVLQQAIHEAVRAELQPIQAELQATRAELETIQAALNTIANSVQRLQVQLELDPLAACSRDSEGEEEQTTPDDGRDCTPGDDEEDQKGDGPTAACEALLPQAAAATRTYTVGQQQRAPEPIILTVKPPRCQAEPHEEGAPQ